MASFMVNQANYLLSYPIGHILFRNEIDTFIFQIKQLIDQASINYVVNQVPRLEYHPLRLKEKKKKKTNQ